MLFNCGKFKSAVNEYLHVIMDEDSEHFLVEPAKETQLRGELSE